MAAECRDFRMDKYSVVSGIFAAVATRTCTGTAAATPPGAFAELFPQPGKYELSARTSVQLAIRCSAAKALLQLRNSVYRFVPVCVTSDFTTLWRWGIIPEGPDSEVRCHPDLWLAGLRISPLSKNRGSRCACRRVPVAGHPSDPAGRKLFRGRRPSARLALPKTPLPPRPPGP